MRIAEAVVLLVQHQRAQWRELRAALGKTGIVLVDGPDVAKSEKAWLEDYFLSHIFTSSLCGADFVGLAIHMIGPVQRSDATKTFKRGMDAHNNPEFYRQIGKVPEQLVANSLDVLATRFDSN